MATTTIESTESFNRFMAYARDAGNWGGEPLVGGNVGGDAADKGYLLNLKKEGLIETADDGEGCVFVVFTAAGKQLAAKHGITL